MNLERRDRVRDLCETYGAAWVESPAEMLRRMSPAQRARLAGLRDEQSYLLARGEPSPRLDPALARADEIDEEMERRVALALAARRLGRRALGEERAAPAGPHAVNAISLCSGIGGLDLGLSLAIPNYQTICYVEKDKPCQDLLLTRMADGVLDRAPIWGDLTEFDGRPWRGLVDLVHGGAPCQPFSTAGKRRGADDERHLWPHVRRVIEAVEPEWYLFENVAGHLSLETANVVRDLVGMGRRVALGVFTAVELGAPHQRERLFILAHSDAHGLHEPAQAQVGGRVADGRGGGGQGEEEARRRAVAGGAGMGDPGPAAAGGEPGRRPVPRLSGPEAWRSLWGRPRLWPPLRRDDWQAWRGVRALDPSLLPPAADLRLGADFVEWKMGLPRGWTGGMPRAARLGALGNGVVPAAAALAWHELSAAIARGAEEELAS